MVQTFVNKVDELRTWNLQVVRLHHDLINFLNEELPAKVLLKRAAIVSYKTSLACYGFDHSLRLQLSIGFGDGVPVEAEVLGEWADRR
jgi:hypothetical protein